MSAVNQIVEWADQIEQSDLSQHEKKVLSFAENHCKVRADLIQAAGVILRMIQEIDSAEQFNEMLPVHEIRKCAVAPNCIVVDFKGFVEGIHSGDIQDARPSFLNSFPSLRSE